MEQIENIRPMGRIVHPQLGLVPAFIGSVCGRRRFLAACPGVRTVTLSRGGILDGEGRLEGKALEGFPSLSEGARRGIARAILEGKASESFEGTLFTWQLSPYYVDVGSIGLGELLALGSHPLREGDMERQKPH